MDKLELQAEMKRKGQTYETLSRTLGLSTNAFWRKMNGRNEFTLGEVQEMIKVLEMGPETVKKIFLS